MFPEPVANAILLNERLKSYTDVVSKCADCCKSFHLIYSTTLDYVDALLSNGSRLCLVDSKERLDRLVSSPFSHHQISVYVVKPLYTAREHEKRYMSSPIVNNLAALTKTLQTVPGLGPKHVNKLLSEFGSLYNITNASLGDLEKVLGEVLAMTVYQFLH
ncbi:hypothetical protein ACHWQZ_G012611 [Mnemiopsis leidyi]